MSNCLPPTPQLFVFGILKIDDERSLSLLNAVFHSASVKHSKCVEKQGHAFDTFEVKVSFNAQIH
jgi:hypothetical protein